jgi:hypothetical protein
VTEEHPNMTQEDVQQRPTIMLTLDQFGDVDYGANRSDIPPHLAIYMLEVVKMKLLTQTVVQAAQAREASKPKIHTPRLAVDPSAFR